MSEHLEVRRVIKLEEALFVQIRESPCVFGAPEPCRCPRRFVADIPESCFWVLRLENVQRDQCITDSADGWMLVWNLQAWVS